MVGVPVRRDDRRECRRRRSARAGGRGSAAASTSSCSPVRGSAAGRQLLSVRPDGELRDGQVGELADVGAAADGHVPGVGHGRSSFLVGPPGRAPSRTGRGHPAAAARVAAVGRRPGRRTGRAARPAARRARPRRRRRPERDVARTAACARRSRRASRRCVVEPEVDVVDLDLAQPRVGQRAGGGVRSAPGLRWTEEHEPVQRTAGQPPRGARSSARRRRARARRRPARRRAASSPSMTASRASHRGVHRRLRRR